ncbi:MAG: DUF1788 domain-containing protein [Candidatus Kapaibacterium sp.]
MPNYNTDKQFEGLFKILSSPRFLNKEGLGGELPHFIHSYPIRLHSNVTKHIQSLNQRLTNQGITIVEIDLYRLCIEILTKENLLEQILNKEKDLPKPRLLRVLNGPLNMDKTLIPEIQERIAVSAAKIVFITGVGEAFPVIRSHTILNNVQTVKEDIPLVLFFPGTYNNDSLTLFDRFKDDNYYRAHNLNNYTI